MDIVTVRWIGPKLKFEIESERGHKVISDEPEPLGSDEGMTPTRLLLGAVAVCSSMSFVSLLQKMRQPLESLEIIVEGDTEEQWPKAFTQIRVKYILRGNGKFDEQLVAKALDLAIHKYCPVSATLSRGVHIEPIYSIDQASLD
jgi:putative redox protein